MIKQDVNFFLQHLEKIILPLVGLFCLWLLITQVLVSPEYAEHDGQKFSPSRIDDYIKDQAQSLEVRMNEARTKERESPKPHYEKFTALMDSTFNINPKLSFPIPFSVPEEMISDRQYYIPQIGSVNDIDVEHIRAVAYVPTAIVDQDNPYENAQSEPNDIDLVTVSAKFSLADLYENLYQNYAGDSVKADWRDPCLAEPIFAAVHLQRQQLLEGGTWSQWQDIPRTKIDHQSKLLETIEDIKDLPRGGIKVRMLLFDNIDVTKNILQPQSYQIASAEEDWLPPKLHREFLKYKRLEKEEQRRQIRQDKIKQREDKQNRDRTRVPRRERPDRGGTGNIGGGIGGMGGLMGGLGGGGGGVRKTPDRNRDRSREREPRRDNRQKDRDIEEKRKDKGSINDVYKEYENLLISEEDGLSSSDNELVFWAHDDTTQPGKIYQYRIRLGIFNPLAGTNKLAESVKKYKDKVILWSSFSDVSSSVEIPAKLYFFPLDIQKAANAVEIDVLKYTLGYWYSEKFQVKQGELIGSVKPVETEDETENRDLLIPKDVDYNTGAVFVDSAVVNDWAGGRSLSPREYFTMYYSYDGTDLKNIPINKRYWALDMRTKYNKIQSGMKEPKEPLRAWGSKAGKGQIRPTKKGTVPTGMEGMLMLPGMLPVPK